MYRYIDEAGGIGYISIPKTGHILDCTKDVQHLAIQVFCKYQTMIAFKICVIDFDNNKSVIFEVENYPGFPCTVY